MGLLASEDLVTLLIDTMSSHMMISNVQWQVIVNLGVLYQANRMVGELLFSLDGMEVLGEVMARNLYVPQVQEQLFRLVYIMCQGDTGTAMTLKSGFAGVGAIEIAHKVMFVHKLVPGTAFWAARAERALSAKSSRYRN